MVTTECTVDADKGMPSSDMFSIMAIFERVDSETIRSYTKELQITNTNEERYILKQGPKVVRNLEELTELSSTSPVQFSTSKIEIVRTEDQNPNNWKVQGDLVKITFANGYELLWDGVKTFKIIAPEGQVDNCGLCGNNDGQGPDMLTGPHTVNETSRECDGKKVDVTFNSEASSEAELINSWFAEKIGDSSACQEECRS
ncbi:hypothetical protein CAPTEDRAFT_201545 [Capitella teleta]|uniref:VWFD domain-containing protein n=1 Tax=Capitella teleta TaxID=283909 RepID=R7U9B1_CAPTE|nr:hypothetical protein CAPTEDRAFT_201545 [Capitella teleta]|eukprot:ELU02731.1 hypothetical protein CAPTEDRAFT_201545 [Capitella teleta]